MSKPRSLQIVPVLNGYMVNIGCQTLAYDSRSKMLADLAQYLENPKKTEVEHLRKAVHPVNTAETPQPDSASSPMAAQDYQPLMGSGFCPPSKP